MTPTIRAKTPQARTFPFEAPVKGWHRAQVHWVDVESCTRTRQLTLRGDVGGAHHWAYIGDSDVLRQVLLALMAGYLQSAASIILH
jgi:hypothetical protein